MAYIFLILSFLLSTWLYWRWKVAVKKRYSLEEKLSHMTMTTSSNHVLSGVLHDLNNLLLVAKGSSFVMKRKVKDLVPEELARLDKALSSMALMIKTQQEAAKHNHRATIISLKEATQEVLFLKDSLFRKLNIEVVQDIPGNLRATVSKGMFLSVLMNLLKNASESITEAQCEKGLIHIRAWEDEQKVYLSITDNGKGVPEDFAESLFVHGATTKEFGHGFGLAAAKRVLHEYNGGLEFDASYKEGARFYIWFEKSNQQKAAA